MGHGPLLHTNFKPFQNEAGEQWDLRAPQIDNFLIGLGFRRKTVCERQREKVEKEKQA